jgi:hypothetical protein
MSKALAVLLELKECSDSWCEYYVPLGIHWRIDEAIKELRAQPKQRMTGEEISQSLRTDHDATNIQSYVAGVELAERYHGIGVDDE